MSVTVQDAGDGKAGDRSRRISYPDIPEDLRLAANEYTRLRSAGLPVPDHVKRGHNLYKRWVANGGRDPTVRRGNAITPAHLREANSKFKRMQRAGLKPPRELVDAHNEYVRWLRYRGQPPEKRKPLPKPEEVKWPYSAYLEWNRLIREGVAPGDISEELARGYAEHRGVSVRKYTKCEDSDMPHGRGCRARHGKSNARKYHRKGVASCVPCSASYSDVPEDVLWCGCCGARLRRNPRSRTGSGADVPRIE